jgi:hypothetical protein
MTAVDPFLLVLSFAAWVTKASSVSSSWIRRLAAASSPCSLVEVPGLTPRSIRSWAFHRYTVDSGQPQFGGDHPHRPTGPHELHYPPAELRVVGSWHASPRHWDAPVSHD